MRKFLVKEDVTFFATTILTKGETVELSDYYNVDKGDIKFPLGLAEILSDKRFQEIVEPLPLPTEITTGLDFLRTSQNPC